MKQLAKQVIEKMSHNSFTQFFHAIFHNKNQRNSPLVTEYSGNDPSILQCRIAYNKFGGFCVPMSSHHRPAAQKIMRGKVYEEDTITYMVNNCGKDDIIHAGTYFGDFLPALSRACGNGAKVWAFEPNPENYRCAKIALFINGLNNVELTNAGLGSEVGIMQMVVSDDKGRSLGGGSHLVETIHNNNKYIDVKIVRIDDMVPQDRKVSILQLDVEGFEKPALTGAMATIRKNRPILILENLPSKDWLSDNIFQLGYRIIGEVCENTVLKVG